LALLAAAGGLCLAAAGTTIVLSSSSSPDGRGASPHVRFAGVNGARIAYYVRGSGPALLMNMGSASTMSAWDPALLDRLARQHRLVIYDYRGIGRSSRTPAGGLTMARLADDAAGLLERLAIPRADVLGWSLGGFVAQQLAVRHPGRVRRLILAATNPGGSRTRLGPEWAQRVDSDPNATDAEQLAANFPRTPAGRAAARAFLRRVERAADNGRIPDDFVVPRSGYEAQLGAEDRWLRSEANYEALAHVRARTLVADGSLDVLTPPVNSRRIAARIPGARISLFPRAGHAFLFQLHERLAREVERFLS
jgi:pimeloyl-ACP methyl ester carboxylesterase